MNPKNTTNTSDSQTVDKVEYKQPHHKLWAKFFTALGIRAVYCANKEPNLPAHFYLPEFNTSEGTYVIISDMQPAMDVITRMFPMETWVVPMLPSVVGTTLYGYDSMGNMVKNTVIITDRALNPGYRLYYNPKNVRVGDKVNPNYLDSYCRKWVGAVAYATLPDVPKVKPVVASTKPTIDLVEKRSIFVNGTEVSIARSAGGDYQLCVGDVGVMLTTKQIDSITSIVTY